MTLETITGEYVSQVKTRLQKLQPEKCHDCMVANSSTSLIAHKTLEHSVVIETVIESYAEVIGDCESGLAPGDGFCSTLDKICTHPIYKNRGNTNPSELIAEHVFNKLNLKEPGTQAVGDPVIQK